MKTCVLIVIILTISTARCASLAIGAVVQENKTQQIQDLEKQKDEIYNKLNEAVEDTILTLEKSNNTYAKEGIENLLDLVVLMDKFNGTDLAPAYTSCNGSKECASNFTTDFKTTNETILYKDGRRFVITNYKPSKTSLGFDPVKEAIIKMGFVKNELNLNKVKDEKLRNLIAFQAKLEQWFKIRREEKRKMREERLKLGRQKGLYDIVSEYCPHYGEMRGDGKTKIKYPCCRKCCKKSYLGCLK